MTRCFIFITFLIKDHCLKLKKQLNKDGWDIQTGTKEWKDGISSFGQLPSSCVLSVILTHGKTYKISKVSEYIISTIDKLNLKYYSYFLAERIDGAKMDANNFELPKHSHKPNKTTGIIPEYLKVIK